MSWHFIYLLCSARFSVKLYVTTSKDGNTCKTFLSYAMNSGIPGFKCNQSHECKPNGDQIVNGHATCNNSGDETYDFFTFPHDTAKYCRKGFCICMNTRYVDSQVSGDDHVVHFRIDDDHAWSC